MQVHTHVHVHVYDVYNNSYDATIVRHQGLLSLIEIYLLPNDLASVSHK